MPTIQEFAANNPWGFTLIVMCGIFIVAAILNDGPRQRPKHRGRRW
jgi:hypothetical protein